MSRRSVHDERLRILRALNVLGDRMAVVLAFAGTRFLNRGYIHQDIHGFSMLGFSPEFSWGLVLLVSLLVYPFLLDLNLFYPVSKLRPLSMSTKIILKSVVEVWGIMVAGLLLIGKSHAVSFLVLTLIVAGLLFVLSMTKEIAVLLWLRRAWGRKKALKACLFAGEDGAVREFFQKIKGVDHGLKISGVLSLSKSVADAGRQIDGIPVLGGMADLISIARKLNIELVVIAAYEGNEKEAEKIISLCEERGIEVWLRQSLLQRKLATLKAGYFAAIPMLQFSSAPEQSGALLVKYTLDRILAILFLPFLFILYVPIAIGIKLSSPGPVFFNHVRGNLYGRPFAMYKFRTMIVGSEEKEKELEQMNRMKGPVFKIKDDPRIFPFGRILRKTSLDEFPQIINVLLGDMSMVGPRPSNLKATSAEGWRRRRLTMKPGMTGLWQVSGRSLITDFDERARLEVEYIDTWSLWQDVKILFRTVIVVLTGYGAQ